MRAFVFIALFFVLGACSAGWHMRKAISKDPSIAQPITVRLDTVVVTQPRYLHDTVVLNDVDSIIINKDNVITKIWRVHDTLRVNTICPGDTVKIEVIKHVPQFIYQPSKWHGGNIMKYIIWGFAALLIVLLFAAIYRIVK